MDKWKIAIKLVAKCTSEHGLIDFKIVFLMLLSSGNVAANLRRGVFCVDDPAQGATLYRYSSWDRVRTYPCQGFPYFYIFFYIYFAFFPFIFV